MDHDLAGVPDKFAAVGLTYDVGLPRQQQHVVEGQAKSGERSRDVSRNAHLPILRPGGGASDRDQRGRDGPVDQRTASWSSLDGRRGFERPRPG